MQTIVFCGRYTGKATINNHNPPKGPEEDEEEEEEKEKEQKRTQSTKRKIILSMAYLLILL